MLEATKDVERNGLMCRKQRVHQVYKLLTEPVDQQLPKVYAVVKRLADRMFLLLGKDAPCGVSSSWRPVAYDDFVGEQLRYGKGDGNRINAQNFEVNEAHALHEVSTRHMQDSPGLPVDEVTCHAPLAPLAQPHCTTWYHPDFTLRFQFQFNRNDRIRVQSID